MHFQLMGHTDATIPSEEIRKQYREYVKRQSKAEEKLERGIDILDKTPLIISASAAAITNPASSMITNSFINMFS